MFIIKKLPRYIAFSIGTLFFSILAVTCITFGISATSGVVDGSLDPYFQNGKYDGFDSEIFALAIQSDGKSIVGGEFTSYRGIECNYIARLNTDGSLDTTFNVGLGFDSGVRDIIIQPDGKILAVGDFHAYNGEEHIHLIRLNTDGSPDLTFAPLETAGGNNQVIVIYPELEGKFLVGGSFWYYGDSARKGLVRINSDGSIDDTFNPSVGIGKWDCILDFKVQSDGKILVGGEINSFAGVERRGIVRVNTDGSVDETFDSEIGVSENGAVTTLAIQSDGKILIGGSFETYNDIARGGIARLNEDGTLDSTFVADPGMEGSHWIFDVKILPDGKILVSGSFDSYNGVAVSGMIEINSDGSLDSSFSSGIDTGYSINRIELLSSGRILIVGDFNSYDGVTAYYFAKINSNGSLDTTFSLGENMGFNSEIYAIAIQPDGKIIVGGSFTVFDNTPRNYIARLNSDGTLDTSFTQPGDGFDNSTSSIAIQPDGKILVGGGFSSYGGVTIRNLARLNIDGTLDMTFQGLGEEFNSEGNNINGIVVLSDGSILAAGRIAGESSFAILKLDEDGTVDETFAELGYPLYGDAVSIKVQADGKILLGGYLYDEVEEITMLRLNSDGSRDNSFALTGEGFDQLVVSIDVQTDGKILVGGYFQYYDTVEIPSLVRLNSDGTYDSSFSEFEKLGSVATIFVQPNGQILIGGAFGNEDETDVTSLIRLNSDGTYDSSFDASNLSASYWPMVSALKVQLDGKIVIGGYFMSYNGISAAFLTRLGFTDILPPTGSIVINSNANSTTNRNVSLTLSASDNLSGVSQVMICNNPSFAGCTWQSHATTKTWSLDSGLGTKTVYVKYKDGLDLESQVYTDTIRLVAPTVVVPVETVVEIPTQPIEVIPTPEIVTTVIQILDNDGKAIVGARVEIEGNQYITDTNGRIQIQGSTKGKSYSAKISYKGKTYTHEVLGANDNESKIVLDAEQADLSTSEKYSFEWKKTLLYGSFIVAFVLGIVTFTQIIRKKRNL